VRDVQQLRREPCCAVRDAQGRAVCCATEVLAEPVLAAVSPAGACLLICWEVTQPRLVGSEVAAACQLIG